MSDQDPIVLSNGVKVEAQDFCDWPKFLYVKDHITELETKNKQLQEQVKTLKGNLIWCSAELLNIALYDDKMEER